MYSKFGYQTVIYLLVILRLGLSPHFFRVKGKILKIIENMSENPYNYFNWFERKLPENFSDDLQLILYIFYANEQFLFLFYDGLFYFARQSL